MSTQGAGSGRANKPLPEGIVVRGPGVRREIVRSLSRPREASRRSPSHPPDARRRPPRGHSFRIVAKKHRTVCMQINQSSGNHQKVGRSLDNDQIRTLDIVSQQEFRLARIPGVPPSCLMACWHRRRRVTVPDARLVLTLVRRSGGICGNGSHHANSPSTSLRSRSSPRTGNRYAPLLVRYPDGQAHHSPPKPPPAHLRAPTSTPSTLTL